MHFQFATAGHILFGNGRITTIGELAAPLGNHALVVTGATLDRVTRPLAALKTAGVSATVFQVRGEPTVTPIQEGVALARQEACDLVIAIGGGAVLDTGKAIAILATNRGEVLDYLEVIGNGKPLKTPPLPCLAVPTTAGTGAEVTANSVIGSPQHGVKVSLRSPMMLPRVALIDPQLTLSMPPAVTAATGLDALTQVIEPFVSHQATPITDALCREGIQLAARSLRTVCQDGGNLEAREDMALVSLYGGLALANAKLGAVHGIAGPFGGMFDAPHGAVCAALLPSVMAANVQALQERQPHNPALVRYRQLAALLTGDPSADLKDGPIWITRLCRDLQVQPLARYGLSRERIPELTQKALKASSMQGNPIRLHDREVEAILTVSLGENPK